MTLPFWLAGASDDDDGSDHRSGRGAEGTGPSHLTLVRGDTTPAAQSEHALAARVREGDPTAFETLFRAYHAKLLPFAASYVSSTDVADEIVADVFAWLWEHREAWRPSTTVASYLFGAVRNRALNEAKRDAADRRRVTGLTAGGDIPGSGERPADPARQIEQDDYTAVVWHTIDAMPERRRLILTLRWRHELGWSEIAAVLGTTSAAVQMDHSRALRILREQLETL